MSVNESESWFDRWWLVGLILFGLGLIALFALFHPHY